MRPFPKRAAVVGGGISGLTTAYRLARAGLQVSVFESAGATGGLASAADIAGFEIDRYFHFICAPDSAYLALLDDLGLNDRVHWRSTTMGVYSHGTYHEFGTPVSLLGFDPLPMRDRLRFGVAALKARTRTRWDDLDSLSAREWLIQEQGERCYETIWRPLLEHKFGPEAQGVSAAWMWARINRLGNSRGRFGLTERLGYLDGGSTVLVEELSRRIRECGGVINTSTPVERVLTDDDGVRGVSTSRGDEDFDVVISTVAPELLCGMVEGFPAPYEQSMRAIEYHGIQCWTVLAEHALGKDFWLNVDDLAVPLAGVINFTRLDPLAHLGGLHLHYVPLYMDTADPHWKTTHDQGRQALLEALDHVQPGFSQSVVATALHRDRFAQPVYSAGYAARNASLFVPATPIPGLYRSDMSQVYPHDRSLVNAVDRASITSQRVLVDLGASPVSAGGEG